MWYTLMLDGVPVGRVELAGARRAAGTFLSLRAFERSVLQRTAQRLGLALKTAASPRIAAAVSARALAAALAQSAGLQDRLGLMDFRGAHAAVIHILVVQFPRDTAPIIVVELREQAAPCDAELPMLAVDPGHRSRPAA